MIGTIALAAVTSGWHAARAIVLPPVRIGVYARLALPQSLNGGPESAYADVRIADGAQREIPYALDADPLASPSEPVQLLDAGFVPGKYTQAIADLGTSGALHSALTLQSSQPTYFQHVEIATSDDRQTWSVVTRDALIYRVQQNGDGGRNEVPFGPSRARWLRIRVLDPTRLFPIVAAAVPAHEVEAKLAPLQGTVTANASGTQTVVTIDFGTPNTNLGAVAFETATREFSRGVTFNVEATQSGSDWTNAGTATISRYAAGRPQLTAEFGDQHARRLRVTVDNGNDPPLSALRVTALGYQHHLIFAAAPHTAYRLIWDNPSAQAPAYDLAQRLAHEDWRVGAVATLGATAGATFAAASTTATPWLQQTALPTALGIAFVVLGAIALGALRKRPAA